LIVAGQNSWYNNANDAWFGFEGVLDGSSNTALFSERLYGVVNNPQVPKTHVNAKRGWFPSTGTFTKDSGDATAAAAYVNACKAQPGTTLSVAGYGVGANGIYTCSFAYITNNGTYCHWFTPNTVWCQDQATEDPNWGGSTGLSGPPTSNHSGGVNMCMGDGSVKFIKDTIQPATFWALGTRALSEMISADAY